MWTIQEFLLSKSAIFLMGNTACSPDALYTYYCFGGGLVGRHDLTNFFMRSRLSAPWPRSGEVFGDFMDILIRLAARSHATDPRDKVYGMMAILRHQWPDLPLPEVDYSFSIAMVYAWFTRSLILTTESLWVLQFVTRPAEPGPDDIPSWALDLRDPDRLAPNWRRHFRETNLPASDYHITGPGFDHKLTIRTKKIGRVVRISARMPSWDSKFRDRSAADFDKARTACLSEWTAFVTDLDGRARQRGSPYQHWKRQPPQFRRLWTFETPEESSTECPEPYTQALEMYTREMDYLRLRHQPEDDVSSIDSWGNTPTTEDEKGKAKKEKKAAAEKSLGGAFGDRTQTHDKCLLFLLSTGHLAEGPGDVWEGDGIYIAEGSATPLVLRRHDGRRHIFVGQAMVFEKDQGDKWDPSKLGDDPKARQIVLI
jgi:hypothetical protein